MSFLDEPAGSKKSTFADRYLKLVEGIPVSIQILDEHPVVIFRHWLVDNAGRKLPVKCLGFNCPICLQNKQLGEDYKKHKDYNPSQKRYLINVLNVSLCKKTPSGEIFLPFRSADGNLVFPEKDSKGNSLIELAPEPLNQVFILERGPQLFKEIDGIDNNTFDEDGNRYRLPQLVLKLVSVPDNKQKPVSVEAIINSKYLSDPSKFEDKKFEFSSGLVLEASEIQAVLDGTTFTDILAAKNAENEAAKQITMSSSEEISY